MQIFIINRIRILYRIKLHNTLLLVQIIDKIDQFRGDRTGDISKIDVGFGLLESIKATALTVDFEAIHMVHCEYMRCYFVDSSAIIPDFLPLIMGKVE